MQRAGLGAPVAPTARLPSWRAQCPGSPSRGKRVCLASFSGSPAGVPGDQGAALALGVPLRGGVLRALQEREDALRHQPLLWWEHKGDQLLLLCLPQGQQPGPASTPLSKPDHRGDGSWYLEALGLRGPSARAGLALQAPQEVAQVEKVLVNAVVQAVSLQVHLEALAWQNNGWGVLVGLQNILCVQKGEDCMTSWPGGARPPLPTLGDLGTSRWTCQGQWGYPSKGDQPKLHLVPSRCQ